jgi:hypothetical protein
MAQITAATSVPVMASSRLKCASVLLVILANAGMILIGPSSRKKMVAT